MSLKLLFFAKFCELLDCSSLCVEVGSNSTVAEVCQSLTKKGGGWQDVFKNSMASVKIAVNQEIAQLSTSLEENDEFAFFPPVTGR